MHKLKKAPDCCCRTALAEAEIEYNDSYCSPSIYVKYRLQRVSDAVADLGNVIHVDAFSEPFKLNRYFFVTLEFYMRQLDTGYLFVCMSVQSFSNLKIPTYLSQK